MSEWKTGVNIRQEGSVDMKPCGQWAQEIEKLKSHLKSQEEVPLAVTWVKRIRTEIAVAIEDPTSPLRRDLDLGGGHGDPEALPWTQLANAIRNLP